MRHFKFTSKIELRVLRKKGPLIKSFLYTKLILRNNVQYTNEFIFELNSAFISLNLYKSIFIDSLTQKFDNKLG